MKAIKGKRDRGAVGILKMGGSVYTSVIKDPKSETLYPIIKSKVQPDNIVCTD